MIIDKKGKLFGKVSVIDIITILIIVVVGFFLVNKFKLFTQSDGVTKDDLEIVFYQEEVNDFSAKAVKIGDTSSESLNNVSLGEVTDVKIDKSVSWDRIPYGDIKPTSRDGYVSVKITLKAKGELGPNGINLDGSNYYVGQTINLKVGNSIFYGDIADVKKL